MQRNANSVAATRLLIPRAALNLVSRIVYNLCFPMKYVAAFAYWIRGYGDNLARAVFPTAV